MRLGGHGNPNLAKGAEAATEKKEKKKADGEKSGDGKKGGGGKGAAYEHGFTIGSGALATQAGTVVVHCPELNVARSCALDYFAAQQSLPKIFPWDRHERLDRDTQGWLKLICADLA